MTGARIVLLSTGWTPRALLRAELIEQGFDVRAVDTWPDMRAALRPGSKPQLAIVDLQGLPQPAQVLHDIAVLMPADRVLVLTAIGSVAESDVRAAGFHVAARPVAVGDIVSAAAAALMDARSTDSTG